MSADPDIDYKGWALELCSLLDAIHNKVAAEEWDHVRGLLMIRFQIAERFGMVAIPLPPSTKVPQ